MRASDNAVLHGGEFDGETVNAVFDVHLPVPSRSSPGITRLYEDTGRFEEHKGFRMLRVFEYHGDRGTAEAAG